ncbi:type I-E CRISPR-associated protein Cas5/CasD [Serratia entomophila]|uniref:type I-E CRISPR-associated protein Cas5/CasD n=1 Tax=Serratia entomophila TaxID=42906 RepID=UPI002179718D|nr:type I-E CRISPR-associated protein Cas5/CasD [Serratia entomophila]CAI0701792.1 CRISPR-associated protein Cas5/CasD, subtype I-E/ECOLI [Serratia entomophila]CAI1519353.1 CRISPR-associated protein Cas5/CasD, subtype I-E/ECOLI [Serratia entomophila]CAI1771773.1 CRISPR-associated protein Cas5/CasD, subtype I-E/ECOLI [Serratia entomophila]CAI1849990.1 CRISPR-associated protein Cas5/CasD, subtype I-E/ECOLI [Serratia entomophila]CAI1884286.1 CRISPR-associated protein Cas5/CasD, subtype I-E/ECOLI 
MSRYLLFQIYAPLVSWGTAAVGEVRHTDAVPSRSALLGLLAAALGIPRESEEELNQFNQHYRFAVLPLSSREQWLRDYHTTQVPRENKKRRYFTRREELTQAPQEVGTMLSSREYRCDAYYLVAVSAEPDAPADLETLALALRKPVFPLYLGRKACPLALPLAPRIIIGDLADAFRAGEKQLEQDLALLYSPAKQEAFCYWEGAAEGVELIETRQRHDRPISRKRWQFGTRLQHSGKYRREA